MTTVRRACGGRPAAADERPAPGRPGRRARRVMAVASAVFGAVLLGVALPRFARDGRPVAFLVPWAVAVVAIVGFNLWTAFRGPARGARGDAGQVTPPAPPPR
ncbi:hypothetical protein [Micromonospora sp. RP3T]|uniref:hypothetical protein n=1 Tax=Micromonospora sp. RP3T TaxID=2135446 RepID=UPI0011B29726|nr:hypothetical protein [Micromonospora sp. RP3T]